MSIWLKHFSSERKEEKKTKAAKSIKGLLVVQYK